MGAIQEMYTLAHWNSRKKEQEKKVEREFSKK